VNGIAEEYVKLKNRGRSEKQDIEGRERERKEHSFITEFSGFAR
jgi:hypothetical protein